MVERAPSLLLSDQWSLKDLSDEVSQVGRVESGGQSDGDNQEGGSEAGWRSEKGPDIDNSLGSSASIAIGRNGNLSGSDVSSSGSGGGLVSSGIARVMGAWEFGLSADGDSEWEARLAELKAYRDRVGDPHCGFREGDDAALVRWAGKQRSDHKRVSEWIYDAITYINCIRTCGHIIVLSSDLPYVP